MTAFGLNISWVTKMKRDSLRHIDTIEDMLTLVYPNKRTKYETIFKKLKELDEAECDVDDDSDDDDGGKYRYDYDMGQFRIESKIGETNRRLNR